MKIRVQFYSYLREHAGCVEVEVSVCSGCTLGELHEQLLSRFPKLAPMKKSMLLAVGVDYQPREYVLQDGDEVSVFPPVQGG